MIDLAIMKSSGFAAAATAGTGVLALLAQASDSPAAQYTAQGLLVCAVVALWRALGVERRERAEERKELIKTMRAYGRAEGRADSCPKCSEDDKS